MRLHLEAWGIEQGLCQMRWFCGGRFLCSCFSVDLKACAPFQLQAAKISYGPHIKSRTRNPSLHSVQGCILEKGTSLSLNTWEREEREREVIALIRLSLCILYVYFLEFNSHCNSEKKVVQKPILQMMKPRSTSLQGCFQVGWRIAEDRKESRKREENQERTTLGKLLRGISKGHLLLCFTIYLFFMHILIFSVANPLCNQILY